MLYIHEKVAKLGNVYLSGQVSTVEVTEAASLYIAQDEKGTVKATQPVGYEQAKISIDIILEDSPGSTSLQQLMEMQHIFREYGQTEAKLIPIVNEDCAARGISQVYFKSFTSKKVISESKIIASLELISPETAEIKITKNLTENPTDTTKTIENQNTKKTNKQSPAKDNRDTNVGKKMIETIIKGAVNR